LPGAADTSWTIPLKKQGNDLALELEGGVLPAFQTLLFELYPDSDNPACPGFPQTQRDTQRFYPHCIISKLISMADAVSDIKLLKSILRYAKLIKYRGFCRMRIPWRIRKAKGEDC
jgi:hypothetical protein